MTSAGLPDSVTKIDRIWGYDSLMLHFATLAMDTGAVVYFTSAAERRLRWVLNGLATDLQYLQKTGVEEGYIKGIYRQAGMLPEDFADAPEPRLWCVLQIRDTRIRSLCDRDGIQLRLLPTAGAPWCFRGVNSAHYAAYVALADTLAHEDAGLPPVSTEAASRAVSSEPRKVVSN
jgi:hypothetical protein